MCVWRNIMERSRNAYASSAVKKPRTISSEEALMAILCGRQQ